MRTALAQNSTNEPISPELVLVDPALRLSTVSSSAPPVITSAAPPPVPIQITATALTPTHGRKRALIAAGTAALAAVAVAGLFLASRIHFGARDQSARVPAPDVRAQRHSPARKARSLSPRHRHVSYIDRSQRLIRWAAVPHASFYDLVLVRNRARVLDVWPRGNHLSLAALMKRRGNRLAAGRYEWFVYPGFGDRHAYLRGQTFYGKISARGVLTIRRG